MKQRPDTPELAVRIVEAARTARLVLLSAPAGSGKSDVLAGVRVASATENVALRLVADFDTLDTHARNDVERAIVGDGPAVVVATSTPCPMDLTPLRIAGKCAQFGLADLALRAVDVRAWSHGAIAAAPEDRAIRALIARTAGWRGAWQIIVAAVARGASLDDLARNFTGAHPHLVAYFTSQVLRPLPDAVQALLLDTAAVADGDVDVDLINAITGRNDALTQFEDACAQTSFATHGNTWRRFAIHPLLRDYLRHESERRDPERLAELRDHAADWYQARGDILRAAQVWCERGRHERAMSVLVDHADDLVTGLGEIHRYREITRSMPIALRGRLATEFALGAIFSGNFAQATTALDEARAQLGPDDTSQRQRLKAVELVVAYGFGRFEEAINEGRVWLQANPTVEPRYRTLVTGSLFLSCFAQLDVRGAEDALTMARPLRQRTVSPFLDGWVSLLEALHSYDLGQLSEAQECLAESRGAGAVSPVIGVLRAWLAYASGEPAQAEQLMQQHFEASLRHGTVELALVAWETAIELATLRRGFDAGMEVASLAAERMGAIHGEHGRRTIALLRGALLLKAPEHYRTVDLARHIHAIGRDVELFGAGRRQRECAHLLLARLNVLDADVHEGMHVAQKVMRDARRAGRTPAWIEASLIHAHGLCRTGRIEFAVRAAWAVVERAAEVQLHACVETEFLLLAPMLRELLRRARLDAATTGAAPATAAARLLGRVAARSGYPESQITDAAAPTGDIDPRLTDTERRILVLVAAGHSNVEIAERRFTRVSSVKWHLRNIFRKLDARSRTAAVAIARQQGLLG